MWGGSIVAPSCVRVLRFAATVEGRQSVPADNTPQKHYNERANIWTPLCGQICVLGRREEEGARTGDSVEGLPRPLPNHLYLFHCVLVSSSVAVVAIYEMALKLFSVSAFPVSPFLPISLSPFLLLFLLQFLLLLLFPVSVSAVAFPFTSFVPKQLTLWLWLNALIYQIGRRPRCYTLSPLSSPCSLLPLSRPFPNRSHFRPALCVPCPLAIVLPKASLSTCPPHIPLIYSSRVKLSSEQTFISVHFYYYKKEKE